MRQANPPGLFLNQWRRKMDRKYVWRSLGFNVYAAGEMRYCPAERIPTPIDLSESKAPPFLPLAKLWILISAFFSSAGWVLSVAGQLNRVGYAVLGLPALLLLGFFGWRFRYSLKFPAPHRLKWRFSRAFPACFLLLAMLAAIGGCLYEPNNYDAMTYRVPRILHWLAEGRWHWIDTTNSRMNYSGVGFGWLATPLLAFTNGDRFFFLINALSFWLMPGLLYATFVRLGVAKRVAWHWMWILPTGYCFLLQAGGLGNDAISASYLLSSICFALRFSKTRSFVDFRIAIIAAALLSGVKVSNLPLLLPCALAFLPSLGLLKTKPLQTAVVILSSLLISFAPIAFENVKHTGSWTGDPGNKENLQISSPVYGLAGNTLQTVSRNLMPPVMPFANVWNQAMEKLLLTPQMHHLTTQFPRLNLKWNELEQEESAGIGLGLSVLAVATLFGSIGFSRRDLPIPKIASAKRWGILICLGAGTALLVFMCKAGSSTMARAITAYYPLVIAGILLMPGAALLPRRRWWRKVALLAVLSALPVIILTPSRPLWPALTLTSYLSEKHPENRLIQRASTVYSVYRNRADCFAPLRNYLSPSDHVVGFIGNDDPETSLWRPFGSRRLVDLTPSNQAQFFKPGFVFITRDDASRAAFGQPLEQWIAGMNAQVLAKATLLTRIARGPQEWMVIRIGDPNR